MASNRRRKPKPIADPALLANDPSLKWNDYRLGEAIWSDDLGRVVRFHHRDAEGLIHLADLVIRELPGGYDPLKIRRLP